MGGLGLSPVFSGAGGVALRDFCHAILMLPYNPAILDVSRSDRCTSRAELAI